MSTIFDGLAINEKRHTNLLRNIMDRHPKVAASALTYLVGRLVSEKDASEFNFQTQHRFMGPYGLAIPDICVDGPSFQCIIEAKIDPNLYLTVAQRAGYVNCFASARERHLSFLVPDGWKHIETLDEIQISLQKVGVTVHLRDWRSLISSIEISNKEVNDPILTEAIIFLKWRFELVEIAPEERQCLIDWSSKSYIAFRKLEKTVDQAKKLLDASGIETEWDTSGVDFYGFYAKRGKLYLLWVGIWTEAANPLSYGYHSTSPQWIRPTVIPGGSTTPNKHHVWSLGLDTWGKPELVHEAILSALHGYPTE